MEKKTTHAMDEIRDTTQLTMDELREATRDRIGRRQFIVDIMIISFIKRRISGM